MADDGYHVFLGLPTGAAAPDHYQLLGLSPDEVTPGAVVRAVSGRLSRLERRRPEDPAVVDRLLAEVRHAQRVLTDAGARLAYDAERAADRRKGLQRLIRYHIADGAVSPGGEEALRLEGRRLGFTDGQVREELDRALEESAVLAMRRPTGAPDPGPARRARGAWRGLAVAGGLVAAVAGFLLAPDFPGATGRFQRTLRAAVGVGQSPGALTIRSEPAGATVWLHVLEGAGEGAEAAPAAGPSATAPGADVRWDGLPPGDYACVLRLDGHAETRAEVVVRSGAMTTYSFTLAPLASGTGR